jgi:hypothetical protein
MILISSSVVASTPRLYADAKAAYEKNDCTTAVVLLKEYKIQDDSDHKKYAAIDEAIGWCKNRLPSLGYHLGVSGQPVNGSQPPNTPPPKPTLPN